MITHSDEIAAYADRVIKIIDGELIEGENVQRNVVEEASEQTETVKEDTVTGGDDAHE